MTHTLIQLLMTAIALGTPCADEGANNCYWDAQAFGNGEGFSYTVTELGGRACINYWDPRVKDYCENV